jgi:uncharacterized protein (TIGR02996 family)
VREEDFLRSILSDPNDDLVRLVFADWLEEHDQSEYAEFIRVQCELEPLRDRYEIDRAAELHRREEELWHWCQCRHQALDDLFEDPRSDLGKQYRRGFLHRLSLTANDFVSRAEAIVRLCPTLRRLKLFRLNGCASRLTACASLAEIPELELACWYPLEQARVLTTSPYLGRLEVLVAWLGGGAWGTAPSEDLVPLLAAAGAWPNLRELILVEFEGNEDADQLVRCANEAAGRSLARVVRPRDGRLPFAADFSSFCPGSFPDGRRLVAKPIGEAIHVIVFGADGRAVQEYDLPQPSELEELPVEEQLLLSKAYREVLHRVVGSAPAFIRVFPFHWPDGYDDPVDGPEYHDERWGALGIPDDPDRGTYREDGWGFGGEIDWIVEGGQFGCGGIWCDKRGRVHAAR